MTQRIETTQFDYMYFEMFGFSKWVQVPYSFKFRINLS